MKIRNLLVTFLIIFTHVAHAQEAEIDFSYLDCSLPVDEPVEILTNQMTLAEKVSPLTDCSAAITRFNIPEYYWWSECLHGVARAGYATVFTVDYHRSLLR